MEDLSGRNAVVTGGGNGIGRGLVLALAEAGANVAVADIEESAGEVVAKEASALGVKSVAVATDVSDATSVQALADRATAELGPIHVLCNNAGVLIMGNVEGLIVDDWRWLLGVNLMGVIHGVHAFLPGMLEHGEPCHIVNTASVAALGGGGPYGTSKAGVLAISESLHGEFHERGIGVSVLLPANISSRINSSQRNRPGAFGRPVDEPFAAVVDFGVDPIHVGRRAVQAIRDDELYVFTFPAGWQDHLKPRAEERFANILAAIDRGVVGE